MIFSSDLFRDIIRPCDICKIPFDVRLHAPHILPCSHTFCLMCLSKHDQRKKRNCFICKTKYSKFSTNLALIEALKRIEERLHWLKTDGRRCDECDNRVPLKMMRQCTTCEAQFVSRPDFPLQCVICLECCVNSHNNHELIRISTEPAPNSPAIESPLPQNRSRHQSTSSTVSVHFRPPSHNNHRITKGIINTIKSWSFRSSSNDLSFLLAQPSKLAFSEEDIVMQCNSPLYDTESRTRSTVSSSRMICMDSVVAANQDNISLDSVFESRNGSPQSTIVNVAKRSPISIRSFCANDSGIQNTPPSRNIRSSSTSYPSPFLQKAHTPCSKFATFSSSGSTKSSRNRIRMGVSDLINSPRPPLLTAPFSSSGFSNQTIFSSMKETTSEGSVFVKTGTDKSFEYL